jgi:hypothetical protein
MVASMNDIRSRSNPSDYVSPNRTQERRVSTAHPTDTTPPKSRGFHVIPSENVLAQLIDRAVSALKQGVHWDRGSILNIEV